MCGEYPGVFLVVAVFFGLRLTKWGVSVSYIV